MRGVIQSGLISAWKILLLRGVSGGVGVRVVGGKWHVARGQSSDKPLPLPVFKLSNTSDSPSLHCHLTSCTSSFVQNQRVLLDLVLVLPQGLRSIKEKGGFDKMWTHLTCVCVCVLPASGNPSDVFLSRSREIPKTFFEFFFY